MRRPRKRMTGPKAATGPLSSRQIAAIREGAFVATAMLVVVVGIAEAASFMPEYWDDLLAGLDDYFGHGPWSEALDTGGSGLTLSGCLAPDGDVAPVIPRGTPDTLRF